MEAAILHDPERFTSVHVPRIVSDGTERCICLWHMPTSVDGLWAGVSISVDLRRMGTGHLAPHHMGWVLG